MRRKGAKRTLERLGFVILTMFVLGLVDALHHCRLRLGMMRHQAWSREEVLLECVESSGNDGFD